MEMNYSLYEEKTELLKVLAHPVRLCIVKNLLEKGATNVSKMQNCLNVPQSTISQHLQKLRTAGIVDGVRRGVEITYSVKDERVKPLLKILFC